MGKDVKIYEPDTASNALTRNLDAPQLDPVYLAIANDSLAGKEIFEIAEEYDVNPDVVTSILSKKEVESYMNSVMLNQGYLHRAKQISTINLIIEKKMQEAMETDVYSKKDILDWMKLLIEMQKSISPAKSSPGVAIQVNNYDNIMKDLIGDE